MAQFTQEVTDANFDSKVLQASQPILVDFWAEWCGPCRALAPILEEVGQDLQGKVSVLKLNVDHNSTTAAKYGIQSIPTMILFKGGKPVGQIMGRQPKDSILSFIQSHTS